jgi:excisionase family DNA binding protein
MLDNNLLKNFLSRREFSNLTGLSFRTTSKLLASRELYSIRVGRHNLIPRVELEHLAKRDHLINHQNEIGAPSNSASQQGGR